MNIRSIPMCLVSFMVLVLAAAPHAASSIQPAAKVGIIQSRSSTTTILKPVLNTAASNQQSPPRSGNYAAPTTVGMLAVILVALYLSLRPRRRHRKKS